MPNGESLINRRPRSISTAIECTWDENSWIDTTHWIMRLKWILREYLQDVYSPDVSMLNSLTLSTLHLTPQPSPTVPAHEKAPSLIYSSNAGGKGEINYVTSEWIANWMTIEYWIFWSVRWKKKWVRHHQAVSAFTLQFSQWRYSPTLDLSVMRALHSIRNDPVDWEKCCKRIFSANWSREWHIFVSGGRTLQ